MNELNTSTSKAVSTTVQQFIAEASDLYVDFLSEGRNKQAESLLSGLLLAVAGLDRVTRLAPGPDRTRELRSAASVFHKLSMLIFVSAVNNEDDASDLRTLRTYDTAADLSGVLSSAARRRS